MEEETIYAGREDECGEVDCVELEEIKNRCGYELCLGEK